MEDDVNPTGLPQVFEESVNGVVQRSYTYGLQRISENQQIQGAWTPSFYGYDGGGSVRQLTNTSAAVTDTYNYDAFGNLLNSTGSTPNNYLYRGEQFDKDLDLYYLRARYYNPATGRFLSRDPENGNPADPRTLHKYLYAGGDPIGRIDPRGREALLEYAFMAYHLTIEGIDFGHDEKGCLVNALVGLATGIGSATDGATIPNEGLNIAMTLSVCSDEADYNLALGFIWSKVFPFPGPN
jgi:RHS repeat-associated protein